MRQLKFAKIPSPAQEAEAAAALRWLAGQPVPAGLDAADIRYVVAVARQYQGHGLGLLELVMAGWQAGAAMPGLWSWRVREGMAEILEKN